MIRTGIIVGSFNPFTIGHDSIVRRALPLFDRLVIGVVGDHVGKRSVKDFEYEREQADINRQLSGIETILLYSEPQLSSVSSTMVRELQHFGVDVSNYLPKPSTK